MAAATGYSHSLPQVERDPARAFAESLGVEVLTPRTHEMEREGYRANAGDRCFFCKAAGFTRADLKRPLVGVANTWIEIGPCNFHLRELAVSVKAGIRAAGGTPMEFNTVSISDGITMGSAGHARRRSSAAK